MVSIQKTDTWEIVDLPHKLKFIEYNKWIYTIKYTSSRKMERYKAKVVSKDYTQKNGVDNTYTFDPVAKHHSVEFFYIMVLNYLGISGK